MPIALSSSRIRASACLALLALASCSFDGPSPAQCIGAGVAESLLGTFDALFSVLGPMDDTAMALSGGALEVYKKVPGGWLHVIYREGVIGGAFPHENEDCTYNHVHYHRGGAEFDDVRANSVVYSAGSTPGALYDVAFTGLAYDCPEKGVCGLDDIRITLTVEDQSKLDGGTGDAAAE